ncbi:LPXTG cell wall anchor domain-containing protein [Enterococcus faecalis]|uniref:LPXTG cell wall anchor domain-containing protein n=1 Tax=Enterococcus faecalis TaxID=1351 RepID=UPI0021CB9681|nr:LPXTG cell wall anchor domain-containing protein [Enterococcus faecalis]
MKKMFLGLFCFVSITTLSVSNVWAEDSANEASVEKSTVTSLTQETSATTINASTDSTALTAESEELPSLRQTLLNYVGMYGLTETLINRLSDDELDYAKKVSFHFVNQDVSGTARMITKLYGEKPIPEDSYSTDYSTLTIDDLKNYLPQIRLSLIYVYDLNSDVVNNLSDQTLIDLINQVKVDYANQNYPSDVRGDYGLASMADKIKANDYTSINQSAESVSSDTTNTESTLQTTTSSTKKATTSSSTEHKKGIFPSTGEKKISFIYHHWNHLTIFS